MRAAFRAALRALADYRNSDEHPTDCSTDADTSPPDRCRLTIHYAAGT